MDASRDIHFVSKHHLMSAYYSFQLGSLYCVVNTYTGVD